jgi:hypothetical protein
MLPNMLGLFDLNHEASNETFFDLTKDLFINPMILYFIWWTYYGIWLFAGGCKLPEKNGSRSSFQDMRAGIKKMGVTNIYGQCCVYLIVHSICNALVIGVVARLCWSYQLFHSLFLLFLIINAINKGAKYLHFKVDI